METTNNKHIDLAYLKQLSNGSNEFVAQMISIFMAQTPEALNQLENYMKAKEWKLLKGVAHKMKPSFSFMGIKELEKGIILVEEYSGNETNLEQLPQLISDIRNVCELALKELEIEKKLFV